MDVCTCNWGGKNRLFFSNVLFVYWNSVSWNSIFTFLWIDLCWPLSCWEGEADSEYSDTILMIDPAPPPRYIQNISHKSPRQKIKSIRRRLCDWLLLIKRLSLKMSQISESEEKRSVFFSETAIKESQKISCTEVDLWRSWREQIDHKQKPFLIFFFVITKVACRKRTIYLGNRIKKK